jgi:hypothetical protein
VTTISKERYFFFYDVASLISLLATIYIEIHFCHSLKWFFVDGEKEKEKDRNGAADDYIIKFQSSTFFFFQFCVFYLR